MSSDKQKIVETYLEARKNNNPPNQMVLFFSDNAKIVDNYKYNKTFTGKKEIMSYFETTPAPLISPTVDFIKNNPDGTIYVCLTFGKLLFKTTVRLNFTISSSHVDQIVIN